MLDEAQIRDLYCVQRIPVADIAKQLGCSVVTFNKHRKRLGIPVRKRQRHHDLTGQLFGKWQVVQKVMKNQRVFYVCRCQCEDATECTIPSGTLLGGRSTKCRRCVHRSLSSNVDVPNFYWMRVMHGARRRGLEVSVTQEQCRQLYYEQGKKCALTGLDISFARAVSEIRQGRNTASLDRIDSSKGYIPSNVQWVHRDVNNMKQDLPDGRFREICRLVSDHEQFHMG